MVLTDGGIVAADDEDDVLEGVDAMFVVDGDWVDA